MESMGEAVFVALYCPGPATASSPLSTGAAARWLRSFDLLAAPRGLGSCEQAG
jgi:hypothetical protein